MRSKKIIVTDKYIDQNGHVGEAGYLSMAIDALWEFNKEIGLSKKYLETSCAPVTFSTQIDYQNEVFQKEEIEFRLENIGQPDDERKWVRQIRLFKNSGDLAVKIVAHGAWFDLSSRKVIAPPKELKNLFEEFIGDPIQ